MNKPLSITLTALALLIAAGSVGGIAQYALAQKGGEGEYSEGGESSERGEIAERGELGEGEENEMAAKLDPGPGKLEEALAAAKEAGLAEVTGVKREKFGYELKGVDANGKRREVYYNVKEQKIMKEEKD